MEVKTYLDRINYRGSLAPTAPTLRELHMAHLLAVPFENLSIHAGEPIVLADDALFDKVVRRQRGGFCYELNGLFTALLRALGFDVAMLSAGVANAEGGYGPKPTSASRCCLTNAASKCRVSALTGLFLTVTI